MLTRITLPAAALALTILSGCATRPAPFDYDPFIKASPKTLLVMPPVNDSPDVKATPSMWSHATQPLSEAGYYVLPVTLVDETLRQNGVDNATDAQSIAYDKLREYFGADAAVYIKILQYGTKYSVVLSETLVKAEARIVDLRTGTILWTGQAQASSAEQQQQNQGGVIGLLVAAIVHQVVGTATDAAYNYGGIAGNRLLGAARYNGILPGPRSPNYGKVFTAP